MSLALQYPFLQEELSNCVESLIGFCLWSPSGHYRPAAEIRAGLTSKSCSSDSDSPNAKQSSLAEKHPVGARGWPLLSTPRTRFLLNELQIIYPWSASWYCFSVVFPFVFLSLPQLIQQYSCPVLSNCLIMYSAEQSFKNETIKLERGKEEQDTQMCRGRCKTKGILKSK